MPSPYLKDRGGGKIITIGSGIGHNGRVSSSAYACAKAGAWILTRVLAQELWEHNISVNELVPGPVATPGATAAWQQEENSVNTIDSEWVKQSEDVLPLALFLATQPGQGTNIAELQPDAARHLVDSKFGYCQIRVLFD